MDKVLVTGGAGYIGAHTAVQLISSGYEPIIIDDLSKSSLRLIDGIREITGKEPIFYQGDCRDGLLLDKIFNSHRISCVMHFAAYKSVGESVQFPLLYYRNNIDSLISIIESMSNHGLKNLIFSSSCTVYGQPDTIPVNEHAPFKRAESPYGATKQICERILEDVRNIGIISLRYFNPIGAHPTSLIGELPVGEPSNLVPYITQTAIGKRKQLTVFGTDYNTPDGSCIRDFIHVVDLADAHIKAMEFLTSQKEISNQVFNVGIGRGVSVLELIETFQEVSSQRLNVVIGNRRAGDVEKTFADPTKINTTLGWFPQFDVAQALLHAWNWEKKISIPN